MLPLLLLLLPTAHALTVPGETLADFILTKQAKCDFILNQESNALEEVGSSFTKLPYLKCKEHLDKFKLQYISKYLLNPSFYSDVFPVKLSNGTVIMLAVPLKEKPKNVPDTSSCSSCEGLCMVHEKCTTLLDDIEHSEPSETSYYKMKYEHCLELLKEQKQKYMDEHHMNDDSQRATERVSVNCKKGTVIIPIPHLEKTPKNVNSPNNSPPNNDKKVDLNDKDYYDKDNTLSNNYKDATDNKRSHEFDINSILKNGDVRDLPNAITGIRNSEDVSKFKLGHDSNIIEHTNNHKIHKEKKDLDHDTDFSIIREHPEDKDLIPPILSINNDKIDIPRIEFDDPHNKPDKKLPQVNDNIKKTPDNIPSVIMIRDTENIANTGSDRSDEGDHKLDMAINTIPIEESLGDQIINKESDCERIIMEANKDYRSFDAVQYYEKTYAECVTHLNMLKKRYAKRNGIQLRKYKSLFPVLTSSGSERLVVLPDNILQGSPPQHLQFNRYPSINGLTLQQDEEGNTGQVIGGSIHGATSDYMGTSSTALQNPAFISNERFYEHFSKISDHDRVSTWVKFTKIIRENAGESERNEY